MFLSVDKYRANPNLILKKLSINESKLNEEIRKLEGLKIIDCKNGLIENLKRFVHLDATHPVSVQNHINWRLESINHLTKRELNPSDFHLSASFNSDEKTKK